MPRFPPTREKRVKIQTEQNKRFVIYLVEVMPMSLYAMSVAEDPINYSSLIVSGGRQSNGQDSNAILRFACDIEEQCNWQILAQRLNIPRSYHVSLFTNKPLNCSNSSL